MANRLTCTHTATIRGERIFAVVAENDSYGHISSGGMPESELRTILEVLGHEALGKDYDVIAAALDA